MQPTTWCRSSRRARITPTVDRPASRQTRFRARFRRGHPAGTSGGCMHDEKKLDVPQGDRDDLITAFDQLGKALCSNEWDGWIVRDGYRFHVEATARKPRSRQGVSPIDLLSDEPDWFDPRITRIAPLGNLHEDELRLPWLRKTRVREALRTMGARGLFKA